MTLPHPSGARHWMRRMPDRIVRGPDAPGAKLSAAQIEELHADLKLPGANKTHLAAKYGVSRYTIWRHSRACDCNPH